MASPILAFTLFCLAVEAYLFLKDSWAYQGRTTVRNDWKVKVFDKKLGTCFGEGNVLPFSLMPGTYRIENGRRVTINSLGYRGAEFQPRKMPDVLRLLFVGDSFTYGFGVDDADTIPRLVEAELRAGGIRGIEVINAGFHGSCPIQYDLYLRHEGYDLDPDVIVMVLFPGNDLADLHFSVVDEYGVDGLPRRISDGLVTYKGRRYHSALPATLYHFPGLDRSVVWHRLNKQFYALQRDGRERRIKEDDGREAFARYVVAIAADCRRRGIAFRPVIAVGRGEMEGDVRSVSALNFIRSVLDADRHAFTDLSGTLGRQDVEVICQPDDIHLNERGNRIAAHAIATMLQPVLASMADRATPTRTVSADVE